LVPERPFDIDKLCASLIARHELGNYASVVVVAEGAAPVESSVALADGEVDAFGHVRLGGIGAVLATEIEKRTGFETRATVLGHIQRGGTPNAFDRVLATRFGVAAVEAVHDGAFGTMVGLQAGDIVRVPLAEAVGTLKTVDPSLLEIADLFSA
jgi:6-phosphofructokinase 1